MCSKNASGAVNQQERLDAYIAGYVDGEGSFHVAVQRNPSTRVGWQLVPEFRVSQDRERRQVIDLIQQRFRCGRIVDNHRGTTDTTLVYVVRRRDDLLNRIIPFFEATPLLSAKQQELSTFASIVRAMADGEHLTEDGFRSLRRRALSMNGRGRYRRIHRIEAFRILRDHTPDTVSPETAPWAVNNGEDMVRPAWRHAEPGGNDLVAG
jgi:LAGLIDADG DNA endonuclease family protein